MTQTPPFDFFKFFYLSSKMAKKTKSKPKTSQSDSDASSMIDPDKTLVESEFSRTQIMKMVKDFN